MKVKVKVKGKERKGKERKVWREKKKRSRRAVQERRATWTLFKQGRATVARLHAFIFCLSIP